MTCKANTEPIPGYRLRQVRRNGWISAAGFLGDAGTLAANMMTEQANLGTTPRNRLHVVFWKQGVKHRILFDVRDGKSAADLEDRCLAFWRQTAASRSQFAKAPGAPSEE